jgi:hypothetical protein
MSLYLTIYSNALHQTDYRLTPPASLLHKLLHRLLYQFSRSQRRLTISRLPTSIVPCSQCVHASSTCSNALQQPMSLLSMTPHVIERMSNALLWCRLNLPRAPKSSTYQSVLSLRHNARNHCAPTNSTYQSVLSPMAQPQKPRVLFDLVNEPTIRCPLVATHQHYPTSIHHTSPT